MSKKRPGVQAAINLLKTTTDKKNDDKIARIWETIERVANDELTPAISQLEDRQAQLDRLQTELTTKGAKDFLRLKDLIAVVEWKHTVGKNRPFNVKLIRANTDAIVQSHTKKALNIARSIDATKPKLRATQSEAAMKELMLLKGVGPATASAILHLVRPDVFSYFYDEVMDCFETTRAYTLPVYMRVNEQCIKLAECSTLGSGTMTTAQVAKILWAAARYMALFDNDLSSQVAHDASREGSSIDSKGNDEKGQPNHEERAAGGKTKRNYSLAVETRRSTKEPEESSPR